MIAMESDKFSAAAYSHRLNGQPSDSSKSQHKISDEEDTEQWFSDLIEEVRSYFVISSGKSEADKQLESETLNRAVLGFKEDRDKLLAVINDRLILKRMQDIRPPNRKFSTLGDALFAEVIGMNVLELILKEREGLEEIQVVGTSIFEVRGGVPVPSIFRFQSIKDVERIQQNLVLYNNEIINPRKRWAEVMLSDGSRVTLTGFGFTAEPTLTIRFYTVKHFSLQTLCQLGFETIDESIKNMLLCLIRSYFNLVIIGPTNSGKTNFIKALIAEMPDHERIITIESRLELFLKRDFPGKNIIEYEIDEDDSTHSGPQAFRLALRQSPKRICHAEIRDADANIYVRACTRGHEGSLTSVHVNQLEDVPDAIADMCMLDGRAMNTTRLTRRIAEYVTQIGIEMAIIDGKRKVVRIGEFCVSDAGLTIRDLSVFDYERRKWIHVYDFSDKSVLKMQRHDPLGYDLIIHQLNQAAR